MKYRTYKVEFEFIDYPIEGIHLKPKQVDEEIKYFLKDFADESIGIEIKNIKIKEI